MVGLAVLWPTDREMRRDRCSRNHRAMMHGFLVWVALTPAINAMYWSFDMSL
ncbi:hypothetical protein ACFU8Q_28085 [Streptomyces sp. NPDC057543]|uniref:hypothetical protein n=1 Tax=Streptomyces sp. NPDC057543 TaxID=3346163 RepID=UPI00369E90EB